MQDLKFWGDWTDGDWTGGEWTDGDWTGGDWTDGDWTEGAQYHTVFVTSNCAAVCPLIKPTRTDHYIHNFQPFTTLVNVSYWLITTLRNHKVSLESLGDSSPLCSMYTNKQ